MDTMMAVRAHERGGPEVLRYEQAPRPVAGRGEVLVEVHAAAVTPGELSWDDRAPFQALVPEIAAIAADCRRFMAIETRFAAPTELWSAASP